MGRYNDEDVNDLVGYIHELESRLAKKDEIIAQKEERIATLEAEISMANCIKKGTIHQQKCFDNDVSTDTSKNTSGLFASPIAKMPHLGRTNVVAQTPNQISDESGEVDESFRHDEVNISKIHIPNEESFTSNDGRWNIPFDDFDDDDLVGKSPNSLLHQNALKDIGFIPIKDHHSQFLGASTGFGRSVVSPVRPLAKRYAYPPGNPGASPIVQAVRRGLLKDAKMDKENVDPARKSTEKPTLSPSFASPCR